MHSVTLTALMALAISTPTTAADRVLSVGGSVTEIVYALGEGDRLVARDSTSSFPDSAVKLPDVGYMRALAPEGVLSVNPDLIIAEEGSGPQETIDVLREAQIDFVTIPDGFSAEAVQIKIEAVAKALGVEDKGKELADKTLSSIKAAALDATREDRKRVIFILSTRGGRIWASGTNTAADGIIALAGATNVISDFEGYKPLTDEAVLAAAPDVILMMDRGGNHSVADDELLTMPSIAGTPAAETRSILRMNGLLLLGFGPRTGEAITALNKALYGA